jgi:uncharacterized protein YkwD
MRNAAWLGVVAVVVALGIAVVPQALPPSSRAPLQTTSVGFGLVLPQGLLPSPVDSLPTAIEPSPAAPKTSAPAASKKTTAPPPVRSRPAIVVRSTQQSLINQDRARYHLGPLTWSSCLANIARYEAAHLATPGVAFKHYDGVSRDLGCHLGRQVGENIGWYSGGINDSKLNSMFMASPEHKANILGPYHYVATAWAVRSDGTAYIAVEFG